MKLCTDPTCTCRTQLPHHIDKDPAMPSEQPSKDTPQLPRAEELIHRMLQKSVVESALKWIAPGVELPLSGPEMRAMKDHIHKLRAFRNEWEKKGIKFS